MREWLVIEPSWKNSAFAPESRAVGYIPRDFAEKLLGRPLEGHVWFTEEETLRMRASPMWRDELGELWSPLGFWAH